MDPSSAPLADYFWIAGVDSISYGEVTQGSWSTRDRSPNSLATAPAVDATIEENSEDETGGPALSVGTPRASARHSRNNSLTQRLSKIPSNDARCSIQTLDEENRPGTGSNRSSITIKGDDGMNGDRSKASSFLGDRSNASSLLGDFNFDDALKKFAKERESFLDDLSFRAGTVLQSRPPMTSHHPRAERLKHEELDSTANGRRSPFRQVSGSIRRKLSFRDLNSLKRNPSVIRSSSVRTSKRLSNYNSVIPPPEPLNTDPDMHPLQRRFEPVLLDRYPPKHAQDEVARRGQFPDYVPMFAFPNDINIVSSDERPRSTWHGFAMTSGDNSKIYGVTVIMWMPLNQDAAAHVERRCEEWRQSHMSEEERELAASLGERLAQERARLSQLLAKLPSAISGSAAREALEDEISATEEKITLMTDLLRPIRHGAVAKIDGLTDGDTGLWTPRAYGIIGRDENMTTFWKEWLRAVVVPMTDGGVLRVPASSPRVGRWQPLERYVVNLCTEALSPITSKTQVEIAIRELRLFARKDAVNEIPGTRNTDLYALFRALDIQNIVALFEFVLSESRIILLSSHTAMLHLASRAIASLLYPLKWASIFIPVLPARLVTALEAPCPYIVGIERRYENVQLPDDDFVLVDLDENMINATSAPTSLPKQQRRKLVSLLQLAAPHHNKYGVAVGPPPYAVETFPYDSFSSENQGVYTQNAEHSTLSKYVGENSTHFGENGHGMGPPPRPLVFNAFLQSKNDHIRVERPGTAKSSNASPPGSLSPDSGSYPPLPSTATSRNDSGFALTATLREKRSGHFDAMSRRSSSFAMDRRPTIRRPSVPFMNGHSASLSTSSLGSQDNKSMYGYAPSTYAPSTVAASTIMPSMLMQPVSNTDSQIWVEGHCMQWHPLDSASHCSVCDTTPNAVEEEGIYKCQSCPTVSHGRCLGQLSLVCPSAFSADKVRAAFVRCFASLFYTYRKYLRGPNKEQKKAGQLYAFDMEGFFRSLPGDQQEYLRGLKQTQAFNEFIHEREIQASSVPSIRLFDEIIMAKRNRGRSAFFGSSRSTSFLADTSDHLWRSASVPTPTAKFPGDYRTVISRVPAKLDPTLMKEPRVIQGVPRLEKGGGLAKRKAVPSMLGIGSLGGKVGGK